MKDPRKKEMEPPAGFEPASRSIRCRLTSEYASCLVLRIVARKIRPSRYSNQAELRRLNVEIIYTGKCTGSLAIENFNAVVRPSPEGGAGGGSFEMEAV